MAICAVVQLSDSVVVNTIVAELTDVPPEGCYLVEVALNTLTNVTHTSNDVTPIVPLAVEEGIQNTSGV